MKQGRKEREGSKVDKQRGERGEQGRQAERRKESTAGRVRGRQTNGGKSSMI
jgi:hypothetical protein